MSPISRIDTEMPENNNSEEPRGLSDKADRPRRVCREIASILNHQVTVYEASQKNDLQLTAKKALPLATPTISRRNRRSQQASAGDEPVTRWSKVDDVILYRAFKRLNALYNLDETDFFDVRGRMSEAMREVLCTLVVECNWKGHIYSLRTRIQRIMKSQAFTARESRKLKRLLKLERKGTIPFSYVIEQFPGKPVETIEMYRQRYTPLPHRNQCA